MPIIFFRTSDAPEAGGRTPKAGEQKWTLSFPLEDGDNYLEIELGATGRAAILAMLSQEDADDRRAEKPKDEDIYAGPYPD